MVELVAGLGAGSEIEINNEAMILLDFIKANWTLASPASSKVDFGARPTRTTKSITLNCYRRACSVRDLNVGSITYGFDTVVAIDVFVREVGQPGSRDIAVQINNIETFLREFILVNRTSLRNKGINNMNLFLMENPPEPPASKTGAVWFHIVANVRMRYAMHRDTI